MVIKVCRNDICFHIVRRMLYRCEGIDFFSYRKYDDSTRMLSGCPADPDTTLYDPVDFTVSLCNSTLFIIILCITECGLIC